MKTFLVNEDEDYRRQVDHVYAMRRPNKANETLTLLHNIPWEGNQVIRGTRNLGAFVKNHFLWGQVKEKKEK